jgi:hypothetical protein
MAMGMNHVVCVCVCVCREFNFCGREFRVISLGKNLTYTCLS